MKEKILSKLKEIEEKENVKIIYAVESGSRAWGFESPDSDYDVRFIYVRHPDDYLSIFPQKDSIDWELNDTFDINGWDLQKALKLLYQSNPTLYEWKNSPITYLSTSEWKMTDLAFQNYFQMKKVLYHYYYMTINTYQKKKTLKKYLYTIRAILSCLWIINYGTPPPIELETLIQKQITGHFKTYLLSLIELKKSQKEKDSFEESLELNTFIEKKISFIETHLSKSQMQFDTHLLDQTFLKILNAIY